MPKTADLRTPRRGNQGFPAWLWSHIAVIAVAVPVVGLVAGLVLRTASSSAPANLPAISAPPCPTLTQKAFAERKLPTAVAFEFDDITFGRNSGNVDCSTVTARWSFGLSSYPVCQFTSPAALSVTTPKGVFYFGPGAGRKATVFVPGGVPRCVLAAPVWSH